MTEDLNTKDLSDRELLLAIRNELQSLNERVATLEVRTNPLPPNYDERFTALETDMRAVKSDLHDIKLELRQFRKLDWQRGLDVTELEQRVEALEAA